MTRTADPPLRLFLVRHAEAIANVGLRYLGSRDDPLTERGTWQASQLAHALGFVPVAAVWSSPLQRAVVTAERIAEPHHLAVQVDPRLREGAFGDWEGLSRAEVLARSEQDAALLARWESDPSCAPPGGEALLDVQARILHLVHDLADTYAGQCVVLVSHVGPIKALLCAALEAPLTAAYHTFLDSATVSVLDWGPHPLVRLFNAHHHLGWETAPWLAEWVSA